MSFSIPTLRAFSGKTTSGPTRNWSSFCSLFNNSNAGGAGILIDGIEGHIASLNYTDSFAVNFAEYIFWLVADYSVSATYSISGGGPGAACNFTTLTGSVTSGMADIIAYHPLGSCNDPLDMYVELTITGLPADFWTNNCCTPFGYCSNTGTFYSATNTISLDRT